MFILILHLERLDRFARNVYNRYKIVYIIYVNYNLNTFFSTLDLSVAIMKVNRITINTLRHVN